VISLATLAGLGIILRGPSLVHQIGTLQSDLPAAVQQIHGKLESTAWGRWLVAQATDPDQVSEKMTYVLSRIGGAMYVTATTVAGLFLVLTTSLYIGAEPEFYFRGIRRIVPKSSRAQCEACLIAAVKTLRMWLVAKIVSMTVIGALIATGLFVVGVPLAGTLAIIAGLLTFVPNLGPILSVFPAALLAFAISPWKGLLTVLVFAIAHFLEGNIVTPLAERKLVKLPPALTLVVQLLLATITGALGVALAAPLTAVLLAVLEQVLPAEKVAATSNLRLTISGRPNVSTPVQGH
jgi:predicted PurR-regulated permease PerM